MFSRLLNYAVSRNSLKLRTQIIVTQQYSVPLVHSKFLHVKVSDADAGLNRQREGNRIKHLVDMEQQDEEPKRFGTSVTRDWKIVLENNEETLKDTSHLSKQKVNGDADHFGNAPKDPLPEDDGDKIEEEYLSRPIRRSRQLRTKDYAIMIKEHLDNHRINEALDILNVRMLKEDRVKPESYIYNLLISGCAKAGYTRKAFQLYTKMRQRGLQVKESTYSSLFNACANAPSRLDGLTQATRLRENLLEKGYEPNVVNYNAMIKAFGRWGDVETAYMLADEMVDKKLEMTGETYNFLLQACASDKELGFRHGLLTWHKMLGKGIKPDYYSFNTILRCTRDCGFGDLDSMEGVLRQILKGNRNIKFAETNSKHIKRLEGPKEDPKPIQNDTDRNVIALENSSPNSLQIQTDSVDMELPNLLAPQPHLGSMVSLAEVTKPHERFLLMGGLQGFLQLMKSHSITPDIQTFTTLLEVIPPTNAAEKQVLTYIRKIGLKADIDFFNILIKKRAMRFDYEGGKEVLSMINTAGLYPDIVTYGVLALGCTTVESARELLQQMRQNNIRMNIQILGAMLRQGCAHRSFSYICEIMQISLDENIKPNDVFLKHLHKFYMDCAKAIDARYKTTKEHSYKRDHKKFCVKYRLYKEEHGIAELKLKDAIQKIRERPYQQYQEEPVQGVEPLKNEKLARKNKLRKYIKKIKVENLKGDEHDDGTQQSLPNPSALFKEQTSSDQPRQQSNANNPFRIT